MRPCTRDPADRTHLRGSPRREAPLIGLLATGGTKDDRVDNDMERVAEHGTPPDRGIVGHH